MSDHEPKSTLGLPIMPVIDAVPLADMEAASEYVWSSVHQHPAGASCSCPLTEGLAWLLDNGYTIKKEQ